jgi:Lrp/AsnC family transcriptional regulator, regulator for asnA, asnC and gidA
MNRMTTQNRMAVHKNPLDTLDLAIINHLRLDGRKSFTDIAAEEGVSVGTVRNRYTQLVENNVLQIYARLNPHVIGLTIYAQILIAVRPSHLVSRVIEQITVFPEVSFLAQVTGEYDLEMNVMCRDNEHLQDLLQSRLQPIEGVDQTRTNIYLRLVTAKQPDVSQLLPNVPTRTTAMKQGHSEKP